MYFIVLVLLPIVTVSILSYTTNKETMLENIRLTNKGVLEVMAKEIEETIEDLSYASLLFVENDELNAYLERYSHVERIVNFEDYRMFTDLENLLSLVSVKTSQPQLHMFLANRKGLIISTPGFFSQGKTVDQLKNHWGLIRPEVELDSTGHFQWLGEISSNLYPERYYYGARVIRDPSNQNILGFLNVGISEKYFHELFRSVPTGRFALFYEGKRFAGSEDVALRQIQPNEDSIRNSVSIPSVGWTLVLETPQEQVTGQLTRTFYISALFIMVLVSIFLVLSVLLARNLHRPIHRLQRLAVQFGSGNRSIRFPVTGDDEINDLGKTLNQMLDQINELIAGIESEQKEKRVMELQALANQIRPHFLLNTLNAMKISLALRQDRLHSEKVASLMMLLRNYLRMDEKSTLKEECHVLRHYVSLMEMRNDMQIDFQANLSEEVEDCLVPKLLLQPLIENAIVHGFSERGEHPGIRLSAEAFDEALVIRISDNGVGMSNAHIDDMNRLLERDGTDGDADSEHIGLPNIARRLRLTYGMQAFLRIESNADAGVTIHLRLPVSETPSM